MIKRNPPRRPKAIKDDDMIKRVLAMSEEEVLSEVRKTEPDPEATVAQLREHLQLTSKTDRKPG
jgi:hypothetical protein